MRGLVVMLSTQIQQTATPDQINVKCMPLAQRVIKKLGKRFILSSYAKAKIDMDQSEKSPRHVLVSRGSDIH